MHSTTRILPGANPFTNRMRGELIKSIWYFESPYGQRRNSGFCAVPGMVLDSNTILLLLGKCMFEGTISTRFCDTDYRSVIYRQGYRSCSRMRGLLYLPCRYEDAGKSELHSHSALQAPTEHSKFGRPFISLSCPLFVCVWSACHNTSPW